MKRKATEEVGVTGKILCAINDIGKLTKEIEKGTGEIGKQKKKQGEIRKK